MSRPILIYLSHGHGAVQPNGIKDVGAKNGKFVEVEMAKKVTNACYNYLLKQKARPYKLAYPERKLKNALHLYEDNIKTKAYSLRYRVVSVDIHFNAGGGDGMEVLCKNTKYSKELGELIAIEFKKIGQNYHGNPIKGDNGLRFLKNAGTSVLVECGFLDNKKDRKLFDTDKELKAMGVAIAKAIIKYCKKYA